MSVEQLYVQETYDLIASSFSSTRYRPWSCVENFLETLKAGSKIADIGCGNGKNMNYRTDCEYIGCDFSQNLVQICKNKGLNVVFGDILNLPFEDESFDHTICIAVLHHISDDYKRSIAISELKRITKKNGKIFILVWAFEQDQDSKRKFEKQDNMIPWKDKQGNIIAWRYYHLFTKSELHDLVGDANIFYEKSNWGTIFTKK